MTDFTDPRGTEGERLQKVLAQAGVASRRVSENLIVAGRVRVNGEVVTGINATGRVRRGLVRSFQVTRLFQEMTPAEHVALAILQRDGRAGKMFGCVIRHGGTSRKL